MPCEPASPLPPNQPNSFCAPCAAMTKPTTRRIPSKPKSTDTIEYLPTQFVLLSIMCENLIRYQMVSDKGVSLMLIRRMSFRHSSSNFFLTMIVKLDLPAPFAAVVGVPPQ